MKPTGKIIARVRERQKVAAKHQLLQMRIDEEYAYWKQLKAEIDQTARILDGGWANKK